MTLPCKMSTDPGIMIYLERLPAAECTFFLLCISFTGGFASHPFTVSSAARWALPSLATYSTHCCIVGFAASTEKVHPGNARQESMLANLQQQLHPKTALQQGYGPKTLLAKHHSAHERALGAHTAHAASKVTPRLGPSHQNFHCFLLQQLTWLSLQNLAHGRRYLAPKSSKQLLQISRPNSSALWPLLHNSAVDSPQTTAVWLWMILSKKQFRLCHDSHQAFRDNTSLKTQPQSFPARWCEAAVNEWHTISLLVPLS